MDAIHRVGLALNPAWNSAVVDHRYKPAVHVFGVSPDTCPPGTFLKDAQRTLSTPATVKAVNDSRLSDLYLIQPGGSVVELSTQFDPNTTLYGTMVSPVTPFKHLSHLLHVPVHASAIASRPGRF